MSSQLTYTDQLAGLFLNAITSCEFDGLNHLATLFASVMGTALESDTVYCIMSQAGNALAKYMHANGNKYVIKDLIGTFISQLKTVHAIPLACIVIGYSGRFVGSDETYSQIMKSVGAVIAKYDKTTSVAPVASATATPAMKLPKKPSDAIIALIKKAVKEFHHDHLFELAKLVGLNLEGVPPCSDRGDCVAAHMIAVRFGFAVAEARCEQN
jgi:hypothetical protein